MYVEPKMFDDVISVLVKYSIGATLDVESTWLVLMDLVLPNLVEYNGEGLYNAV